MNDTEVGRRGQRMGLFWECQQDSAIAPTALHPTPVPTGCDVEHAAHVRRYLKLLPIT